MKLTLILITLLSVTFSLFSQNSIRSNSKEISEYPEVMTSESNENKTEVQLSLTLGLFSTEDKKIDKEYKADLSLHFMMQLGYQFSDYLSGGIGFSMIHRENSRYNEDYLGPNFYVRISPVKYVFLQIQPEAYHVWGSDFQSVFTSCCLLGGGVKLPVGKNKGAIVAAVSYDVLINKYSPYQKNVVLSLGYSSNF